MEMTTAKTIGVFAIIFGCFAVLYPKIFHPMFLHMFGGVPEKSSQDDFMSKMPPHLRKGPGGGHPLNTPDGHMRPGPHPGLRAAAELKKQAAQTGRDGGGGKGMMGVVLPMYAVGIIIYLIYTLSKVFGKGKEQDSPSPDYLGGNNPFKDIRYDAEERKLIQSHNFDAEDLRDDLRGLSQSKRKQRDLERLLLKADERNISENEMLELKRRLLETEDQMTRILRAMESVQEKVGDLSDDLPPQKLTPEAKNFDLSPDMDSYEVISGKSNPSSPSIEDLGAIGTDFETTSPENDLSRASDQGVAAFDPNVNVDDDDEEEEEEEEFNDVEGDQRDVDAEATKSEEEEEEEDEEEEEISDEDREVSADEGDNVDVTLKDSREISDEEQHPDLRKRVPPKDKKKPDL